MKKICFFISIVFVSGFNQYVQSQPSFVWANTNGSSGTERNISVATDAAGNVYTAGYFQLTVDFDPGAGIDSLTSAGGRDVFIQKLDASGNLIWAKSFGGGIDEDVLSVATDVSGNVYTTGTFKSIADFDPGPGTFNLSTSNPFDRICIF